MVDPVPDDDNDSLPDPEDVIPGGGSDDDTVDQDLPDAEEIITIHDEIEDDYDLTHTGARVAAPRLKFERLLRDEVAPHEETYKRAAALLRNIVTSHYFEDGNKRTAWITTRAYLEQQGAIPAVRDADRVEAVLKAIRAYDVDEIAEWLANGELDEDRLHP
jgi:death-on-curing protein